MKNLNDYPAILFYIKRTKADPEGKCKVYVRITVNGKRSEFSTNRKIPVQFWNSSSSRATGNSKEALILNTYLAEVKSDLFSSFQQLKYEEMDITAETLRNRYLGKDRNQKMILEIFEDHNQKLEGLIGSDYSPGTAERYRTAKKHLQSYIKKEYLKNDLPVENIDYKFIVGFEYYLKTVRKCAHNSAVKYITNFKKIIRIAFANDWIKKDPFLHWKGKLKVVDREFLTESELQQMISTPMKVPRLDVVKDIFIFCCFTGLAYADAKKLSEIDIVGGTKGEKWIKTSRIKTKTRSNIPLLPTAEIILEKYNEHAVVTEGKALLPVLSNQKMNGYLKEVADLCGIKKNLTFHLARHTFATTVTLSNGVPIESVSKMLGHTNIRTTQHYAKILDMKVGEDMKALKLKWSEEF